MTAGRHIAPNRADRPVQTGGTGRRARAAASPDRATRAPLNAASAARRAARTGTDDERLRYRQAAAGVSRERAERMGGQRRAGRAPAVVGAAIGVLMACALIWFVGGTALRAFMYDGPAGGDAEDAALAERREDDGAPAATDAAGELEVMGSTYRILPTEGGWSLTYQLSGSDAEPLPLFAVTGEPVGMATFEHFIYVVSNRDGRFHIQSFLPGDGSVPIDLRDEEGTATGVALDGSVLRIAREGDADYTLDLSA